jgi:chemotaxis protein CheD
MIQICQGDYYVSSSADEILATVLGSCVAACVRDPVTGCGGMNHFLLPEAGQGGAPEASLELRYGSFAMEQLVNAVLAQGGRRDRLEIKVFGGANVLRGMSAIGHRNADFVENYVRREGLRITAAHLRGRWPRRSQYSPATGQVRMREIRDTGAASIFDRELSLRARALRVSEAGSVELFA